MNPAAASRETGRYRDKKSWRVYFGDCKLYDYLATWAGMVELADAADSKSAALRGMGVRPPLPALYKVLIINELCNFNLTVLVAVKLVLCSSVDVGINP